MKRADLQLSKGMLVLVEHNGYVRRAIVSDTFYLDCPDTTEPRAGMFDAVLGSGANTGPCGDTPTGDEVEFLPRQVRAVVRLEREATLGTHYDWLAHCRAALEYAETQYLKAPWDQVLGKPWNWCAEAWLGGHDVPCEIDNIKGNAMFTPAQITVIALRGTRARAWYGIGMVLRNRRTFGNALWWHFL